MLRLRLKDRVVFFRRDSLQYRQRADWSGIWCRDRTEAQEVVRLMRSWPAKWVGRLSGLMSREGVRGYWI